MIKAKVVSFTLSRTNGSLSKLELETYLEDQVDVNSFCIGVDSDGMDVVIMTKKEYCDSVDDFVRKRELVIDENEKLREENKSLEEVNKALDSVSDVLRKNLLDEREKTRKLKEENEAIQKDIKDLEEMLAQEADEIDIHPDGTIVFRNKRVSELEKEVEKLKEENKYLKRRLMTRYTVSFDADGAIIYPELKED